MDRWRTATLLLLVFGLNTASAAQVLDSRKLDLEGQPFTYFSHPVDVLGFKDCQEGTELTPEGYLYTGYAELIFFTGDPPVPVNQRIRTLHRGYLPIFCYRVEQDSMEYKFELFAAPLDFKPESNLINFVRMTVRNRSRHPGLATFWAGIRYDAPRGTLTRRSGRWRFNRPAPASGPGRYLQAGTPFRTDWTFAFEGNAFYRSDSLLYLFSGNPVRYLAFRQRWNRRFKNRKVVYGRTTPLGLVKYQRVLAPGDSFRVDLRFPYFPIPAGDGLIQQVARAAFEEIRTKLIEFWEGELARGMQIELPEAKVVNTFKASLLYDLIARDKMGTDYVQKVNEFQYDAFWLRDGAFIVRSYDATGYHREAEECLRFFLRWQREDGNFVSQRGQYDGWGQTLWAFGQHVELTRDADFAREVLPAVKRALAWFEKATEEDSLHLMPVTTPGDNELITGHVTGHNFWAMAGLRGALWVARFAGDNAFAMHVQQVRRRFRKALLQRLEEVTRQTGGYIPPGLDDFYGQDWGNLLSVYIGEVLPPLHPWVTATQIVARHKFREGIMTYLDMRALHHYLTFNVIQTSLLRGEQRQVVEDLYAILLHTSATHAGFEWSIEPWDNRDFGHNLSPHGWFAARYRNLLRNMMVLELGDTLQLFSALSPAWLQPGNRVRISAAPTRFGTVNAELDVEKDGAILRIDGQFHTPPEVIQFPVPWWLRIRKVVVDGKPVPLLPRVLRFPAQVRQVRIQWVQPSRIREVSFERTVEEYLREYRRQYDSFMRHGKKVQGLN
jgi:hypothetical protein